MQISECFQWTKHNYSKLSTIVFPYLSHCAPSCQLHYSILLKNFLHYVENKMFSWYNHLKSGLFLMPYMSNSNRYYYYIMFVILNQSRNASVIKSRAFFVLFILEFCKTMLTSVCAIQKLRLNDL